MIRTEDRKIVENLQESNSVINKMIAVQKKLREFSSNEDILAAEQEFIDLVGDARITYGVIKGDNITTYTINKEGIKINEEPVRSKTVGAIKNHS